jgi:GTP1/Obg family GTP-binding protein
VVVAIAIAGSVIRRKRREEKRTHITELSRAGSSRVISIANETNERYAKLRVMSCHVSGIPTLFLHCFLFHSSPTLVSSLIHRWDTDG